MITLLVMMIKRSSVLEFSYVILLTELHKTYSSLHHKMSKENRMQYEGEIFPFLYSVVNKSVMSIEAKL